MNYWDRLRATHEPAGDRYFIGGALAPSSNEDHFAFSKDSRTLAALLRPTTALQVSFKGTMRTHAIQGPFVANVSPASSEWDVVVNDAVYDRSVRRSGLSDDSVGDTSFSASNYFAARPHFLSPANMAFYTNLPIWGSDQPELAADFMPVEAWVYNNRYYRIRFESDGTRESHESTAELVIDIRHRIAIYYAIRYSDIPTVELEVHSVAIRPEVASQAILEDYIVSE